MPQCVYLMSILTGSQLLQPVDFTLNGGTLAFTPQPLKRPRTFERGSSRGGVGGDACNELGVHGHLDAAKAPRVKLSGLIVQTPRHFEDLPS